MASDRGTLSRSGGPGVDQQAPWDAPAGRSGRLPSAPRERKPALFALAILLVALGAGAAGLLVVRADARVQAIEITQRVNQNAPIPASAMTEVDITAGSGVSYVPWNQLSQITKYFAATTIPAGTLLTNNMVASSAGTAANQYQVGLSLKPGQLPAGLQPGQKVEAFAIAAACGVTSGSPITTNAQVTNVIGNATTSGTTELVTVAVSETDAGPMTCAASNGNVGLALMPGNG
jgi:hypothetical protein